ncbi:MAG: hypothetical protein KDC18_01395 [Alphaproteobacteria bacterium]|nr:hypothetical protein [Alphaproteobacteria bacterium]MCB9929770.1 hypothetical protein [Alphaproteobacteria bacterium]
MLEFRPENFRYACESGDDEAQLYAFWTHSRTGLTAAREGDAATVDSCRRALMAMVDFFDGMPVASQALAAIKRMDNVLLATIDAEDAPIVTRRVWAADGGESA